MLLIRSWSCGSTGEVFVAAGVPAEVAPAPETKPDGVLWKYQSLMRQWPAVEALLPQHLNEYLAAPHQ
jgi:hypothetical protein